MSGLCPRRWLSLLVALFSLSLLSSTLNARRAPAGAVQVLDIDPNWRMHLVSDGQRRRVQIALGLLKPFKVRRIHAQPPCSSLSREGRGEEKEGCVLCRNC